MEDVAGPSGPRRTTDGMRPAALAAVVEEAGRSRAYLARADRPPSTTSAPMIIPARPMSAPRRRRRSGGMSASSGFGSR
jgi:hypothetical protein